MPKDRFKILVVEDHLEMRKFMNDFCSLNGYEADFAFNGLQALKHMEKEQPYSLAIVDFLMPVMHGVDFVKSAKQKWPGLRIIATSAFDDVEESFMEAGADIFLQKPFDPYELEEVVERMAGRAA
jgi:DNA-binding response OmpR family regulator